MEPATAIVGLTSTVAATSAATFLAQVAEAQGGVLTFTSAGATVSAVGALIYVAKAMVSGHLVSRDAAHVESKLADALDTLAGIAQRAERREDRLLDILDDHRG